MLSGKGPKRYVLHLSASALERLQLAHERMFCSDFVIAVGADEEKVAQIGPAQQVLQQIERAGVEPLQIVEEQSKRMLRPSKDADKLPKHQLETPLRILGRKRRNGRRLSDDELHFRNEIGNESCIRSERFSQRLAPGRKARFALAEQRPDQTLKGL